MRIKEKPVTQERALAGATVLGPELRLPASMWETSTSIVYEPPRLWYLLQQPGETKTRIELPLSQVPGVQGKQNWQECLPSGRF